MIEKRTMTLNLTEKEMKVLEQLALEKDLSKTVVLRQALKIYQLLHVRMTRGEKLYFESESSKEKSEILML